MRTPRAGPDYTAAAKSATSYTMIRNASSQRRNSAACSWAPDGRLYFVSDRSGWWNLYRREADGTTANVCPRESEFGQPQWNFGMATYAFLSAGRAVCTYTEAGTGRLGLLDLAGLAGSRRSICHPAAHARERPRSRGFTGLQRSRPDAAQRLATHTRMITPTFFPGSML